MNNENLKAAIAEVIKTNGREEITGQLLQDVLIAMINALGAGYQFMGIATPDGWPGPGDLRMLYIAFDPGTYTNFGGFELDGKNPCLLTFSDEWRATAIPVPTEAEMEDYLAGKQDVIEDLEAIREGAAAGATAYQLPETGIPKSDLSEGVQNSLDKADTAETDIERIDALIPTQASPENQLADRNFVNSSVATNTANYISDNGEPFTSLEDLEAYSGTLTNNDYAFVVGVDSAGNTTYTRYKYNATTDTWAEEYVLNNSSFTSDQWAAINSLMTLALTEKLIALPTADALAAALAAKYTKPSDGIPKSDLSTGVQGSLDKADGAIPKVTTPTAGNVPVLNADGTLANGAVQESNIAEKDGSYDGLTAGKAKQLTGVDAVEAEYTFEVLPSGIGKGYAQMQRILGNSIVWNQIADMTKLPATQTSGAVTVTKNANGSITISGSNNSGSTISFLYYSTNSSGWSFPPHKFYLGATGSDKVKFICYKNNSLGAGSTDVNPIIISGLSSSDKVTGYGIQVYNGFSGPVTFYPALIDLTLMFGEGKESATVEEFKRLYWKYYAFNGGVIKNNEVTAIETTGFNQWDEEWEVGTINLDTGEPQPSTTQIRSKNYCPMFPDTAYCFTCLGARVSQIFWYDSEGNFISRIGNSTESVFVVTSPSNARYCKFQCPSAYGTTYNNDICLSFSTARNGTYEPYRKDTALLPVTTVTGKLNGEGASVTVLPNGPASAGDVRDEVYFDRIVKKIKSYTFTGSETWVSSGTSWVCKNILAGVGATGSPFRATSPLILGIANGSSYPEAVTVDLSAGSTTAEVAAALAGAEINYTLATPEVYILDTPLDLAYFVAPGGTQARIPADTENDVLAPMLCEVTYPANDAGTLERLNANFEGRGGLAAVLDALVAAGVISAYTLAYDPIAQKWVCNVTP